MAATDFDLFEQLSESAWKSVAFPTTTFRLSLRQDLAQHKFPDRDGGHIEGTGRAPLQFSAHIPFINGIVPGPTETWSVLYPEQWRKFLYACSDKTAGILKHPELGDVRCKLESCETVWDATARGGVFVDATWIEDTFDPDQSNATFESSSPITEAMLAALNLDASIAGINPVAPALPEWQPNFTDFMRSIQGVGDTVSVLSARVRGLPAAVAYRANAVQDSFSRAVTSVANDGTQTTALTSTTGGKVTATATVNGPAALLWPLANASQRTLSAMDALRKALGAAKKDIVLYVVPASSTLAAISSDVGADLVDVIKLNPTYLAGPIVPARAIVRYYAKAA